MPLDCLYSVDVALSVWVPDTGGVFWIWSDQSFVGLGFNGFRLNMEVSFDEG